MAMIELVDYNELLLKTAKGEGKAKTTRRSRSTGTAKKAAAPKAEAPQVEPEAPAADEPAAE
jgi:large subunit ribosomal protein L17